IAKFKSSGDLDWVKQISGPANEAALSSAVDSDNHLLIAGSFTEEIRFGDIHLAGTSSSENLFLVKYSPAGNAVWARMPGFGTNVITRNPSIYPTGLSIGQNGLFLGASFRGTYMLGEQRLTGDDADILLIKLDTSGNPLWAQKIGGTGRDYLSGVGSSADGGVFISGTFTESLLIGDRSLAAQTESDFFVAKFTSNGRLVWVHQVPHRCEGLTSGLAVDASGSLYAALYAIEPVASFQGRGFFSDGRRRILLLKISDAGDLIWGRQLPEGQFWLRDERIFVTGYLRGRWYLDRVFDDGRSYFAEIAGDGNVLWSSLVNGSIGQGSVGANSSNVYLAGKFWNNFVLGTNQLKALESGDFFLAQAFPPPRIQSFPRVAEVPLGGELRIKVVAAGRGPLTYRWFFNNVPLSEHTSDELVFRGMSEDQVGHYTVEVIDGEARQLSWPAKVSVSVDTDGDGLSDNFESGVNRFELIEGNFTWEEAIQDAARKGGHLGTITTEQEWMIVTNMARGLTTNIWLAGLQLSTDNAWGWITQEGFQFTKWAVGQPSASPDLARRMQMLPNGTWTTASRDLATWYYLLERGFPTDPLDPDTDEDGLGDAEETLVLRTLPNEVDSDGDGLNDKEELDARTDPFAVDTDRDGLTDLHELVIHRTHPLLPDSDGDELSDGDEVRVHRTAPKKADSDEDGFSDGAEFFAGKDPLDKNDSPGAELRIHHAIELEFFPMLGKRYQIQSSPDLKNWVNIGPVVEATTGKAVYRLFQETRSTNKVFYRVEPVP
ncbi:MAG: hypothetical protein AB1813_12440, partial [Verrucomicrobiota bacterium]